MGRTPGSWNSNRGGGMNLKAISAQPETVFENQLNLISASEFCDRFGYSMKTIYEWKYRPKKNKIPEKLVVKIRGKLFVRADIFLNLVPL
jgi:hypothetical protein